MICESKDISLDNLINNQSSKATHEAYKNGSRTASERQTPFTNTYNMVPTVDSNENNPAYILNELAKLSALVKQMQMAKKWNMFG